MNDRHAVDLFLSHAFRILKQYFHVRYLTRQKFDIRENNTNKPNISFVYHDIMVIVQWLFLCNFLTCG